MIPQGFIDDLNRDADVVSVVGRHVNLTAKGKSHVGLCPFHEEKTPSFNVVADKGFYHCFGCGASGTALGFLMRYAHGNDFVAAVHDLASQMGREVPTEQGKKRVPRGLVDEMAAFYHSQLWHVAKVREYLKGRGISKENALRFKLGYAPKDGGFDQAFKNAGGRKLQTGLVAVGLAKKNEQGDGVYPYFRDRLMFPITSNTGKVQGFGGRLMTDGEPKYLNSPQSDVFDKSRAVFGLKEATPGIRDKGYLVVVEGYMDVLALFEHGMDNAVATMGTAATTQQVETFLTRSDKVCFCFDGDEAGRRAAAKVLRNVMPALKDGKSVRFAHLPDKEDPDSYIGSRGFDAFEKLVSEAAVLEDFLLDREALMVGEEGGASGNSVLWNHIAGLIEKVDRKKAPFLYEELYKNLSKASGIGVNELKKAASGLREAKPEPESKPAQQAGNRRTMKPHLIFHVLTCLYLQPRLVSLLEKSPIEPGKYKNDFLLYSQLKDSLLFALKNKDSSVTVEKLLSERGLDGLSAQLRTSCVSMEAAKENPEEKLKKLIATWLEKSRETRRRKEQLKKDLAKVG